MMSEEVLKFIQSTDEIKRIIEVLRKILKHLTFKSDFYFPKEVDWEWYPVREENITLSPGEEEEIWNEEFDGWIYWAMLSANSPYISLALDIYGNRRLDLIVDIATLYNLGFKGLGQGYFNVIRYDTTNNVYVVAYAPTGLGIPFRGKNVCKIKNIGTSDAVVTLFQAWLIILR